MKKPVQAHGIIPARYASTRFPGKPLADILGKPMFWHVWRRASLCPELASVTLATDDERILKTAGQLGVPALMTPADLDSGTDRVFRAAELLKLPEEAVVINIQGDEPVLDPGALTELIAAFGEATVQAATLAYPVDAETAASPDMVKAVLDEQGDSLYFSRARIPFDREGEGAAYWAHIGIYAFRLTTLRRFTLLPRSGLERVEQLEQLRLLENRIPLRVVKTARGSLGVDRPEDLAKVIQILKSC